MGFEHPFGGAMTGTVSVQVLDPNVSAFEPKTIIQRDHAWQVKVDWSLTGPAAAALGGDWQVRTFLESIGGGFEGQVGPTVNLAVGSQPPASPRNYSAMINVPAANTLGIAQGAYHLVTLINYENMGVPGEIAAVQEGPIVQFYTA